MSMQLSQRATQVYNFFINAICWTQLEGFLCDIKFIVLFYFSFYNVVSPLQKISNDCRAF